VLWNALLGYWIKNRLCTAWLTIFRKNWPATFNREAEIMVRQLFRPDFCDLEFR
jgi:hypothetical protein